MSPTRILIRDELMGFAKSKVMIVMWVLLPLIAIGGYLIIPTSAILGGDAVRSCRRRCS